MIDLMILFLILNRDLTMYAIHKRIQESFLAFTNPSFGALNPALKRLEKKGFVKSSKIMSEGGKLSVFYSITKDGMNELKNLLLRPFSDNALQFSSDARVKLSCCGYLNEKDSKELYEQVKNNAMLHKMHAQKILNDEYTSKDFYQKIVLDNAICEYNNLISLVENLEKTNGSNS